MEISVSSWNELLHFVGGALETGKCAWYLIKRDFDSNDSSFMKLTQEELNITMNDGIKKYNKLNFNPTKPPHI